MGNGLALQDAPAHAALPAQGALPSPGAHGALPALGAHAVLPAHATPPVDEDCMSISSGSDGGWPNVGVDGEPADMDDIIKSGKQSCRTETACTKGHHKKVLHACAWRMAGRPVLPSCHIEFLL